MKKRIFAYLIVVFVASQASLLFANVKEFKEAVKKGNLVDAKKAIDVSDINKYPIHDASNLIKHADKRLDLLRYMVDEGADVNVKKKLFGETLVHVLIKKMNALKSKDLREKAKNLILYLIDKKGADISIKSKLGKRPFNVCEDTKMCKQSSLYGYLEKKDQPFQKKDKELFKQAFEKGDFEAAKKAMSGFYFKEKWDDEYPIHFVARYLHKGKNIDLLKYMIKEGSDINSLGNNQNTPIHEIIKNFNKLTSKEKVNNVVGLIEELIKEKGANKSIKNNDGKDLFETCKDNDKCKASTLYRYLMPLKVRIIIKRKEEDLLGKPKEKIKNLKKKIKEEKGRATLGKLKYNILLDKLELAIRENELGKLKKAIKSLKKKGLDVRQITYDRIPPFVAFAVGNLEILKYLIEKVKFDVNAKDKDGFRLRDLEYFNFPELEKKRKKEMLKYLKKKKAIFSDRLKLIVE